MLVTCLMLSWPLPGQLVAWCGYPLPNLNFKSVDQSEAGQPFEQAACRPAMGLPLRSDKVRGRHSCGFHLICRLLLYNSLHYQICKWSAFKSNLKLKLKYQLWREVCGVQKGSPHEMPICCWQATDDSMSALQWRSLPQKRTMVSRHNTRVQKVWNYI